MSLFNPSFNEIIEERKRAESSSTVKKPSLNSTKQCQARVDIELFKYEREIKLLEDEVIQIG